MNIVNGKRLAEGILSKLQNEVQPLFPRPKLAIVMVGNDDASELYVTKKVEDANKTGIETEVIEFDKTTERNLMELTDELNERRDVNGYFIQLPLPLEGNFKNILKNIAVEKDVDGLNPMSLGAIFQNQTKTGFVPATVLAVIEVLKYITLYENGTYTVDELDSDQIEPKLTNFLTGKNVVIVNHSIIVGKPLAGVLLNHNSTVSIVHKFTKNLRGYTSQADIIISATGKPGIITADMIKENAILLDVGISRSESGVKGDIDFEGVKNKASWITPVPSGIGPLTRAMLLWNTLEAYKNQN